MKLFAGGKAALSMTLCAGLLVGVTTPRTALAHILVKDEGERLTLRYTLKGAQGTLFRVHRDSPEGRRALEAEEQVLRRKALQEPGTVALSGPNSNCLAVKYRNIKGARGSVLSGQRLERCDGQAVCGAPLCTADMICTGALR